jgi:hypothetical protein
VKFWNFLRDNYLAVRRVNRTSRMPFLWRALRDAADSESGKAI